MKLKSITISGMHHIPDTTKKTYIFDNINYIYGSNGIGKSTILQSIQLAILGYIPGTSKNVSSIFKHCNGRRMEIKLIFDDNTFIHRNWYGASKTIKSEIENTTAYANPADIIGDLELPIFNFNELVNMTSNKLKDWFINFLPNTSDEIDWETELQNSLDGLKPIDTNLLAETLRKIEELKSIYPSTIEMVQQLNTNLKDEQSFIKKQIQQSENTINSLIYYDDDELLGDTEYLNAKVSQYEAEINDCTTAISQISQAKQAIRNNEAIQAKIDAIPQITESSEELQNQLEKLNSELIENKTRLSDISDQMVSLDVEYRANTATIQNHTRIIQSGGICPYLNNTCDSMIHHIDTLKSDVDRLQGIQADLTDKLASIQLESRSVSTHISEIQDDIQSIQRRLATISSNEEMKNHLKTLLIDVLAMPIDEDESKYSAKIQQLNDNISKIRANMKYNQLINQLTADKYKLENSLEVYKLWIKLTDPNGIQTRIMNKPFEMLSHDIDIYLNKMFVSSEVKCKFNLEQKANSFSFGITRDNMYVPYDLLSSGEKTMYTLAMMLCIIHQSNSTLQLLIADDMLDHLDDTNAKEVFNALKNISDVQIIVAGIKKSDDDIHNPILMN